MAERTTIQSSGFANVSHEGTITGFRVRLRQPNYRGLRLSLIEGIDVTVGDTTYPAESNCLMLDGAAYTHAQMAEEIATRWPVGVCADVHVPAPGGLQPGVHDVAVTLRLRHPYFPPQFQPVFVRDQRHITIIR
ncbi:hypothetical protein GTZ99_06205 [Novosphingobium sp. FSY-8]|uniref:C-deglycosylation enzyme beta subunit n=1 Tax=Novosphingobium ovatum TaxID=1908523 RepID=A0ABW9XCA5_9SPHN|nr:DUF6379 domain-containing protein [Novosphingobium ovatum]NBC36148.1 hypothetical protein [Novosphingobium ovatum]